MDQFLEILRTPQPYAVAIASVSIYVAEHLIPQRRDIIDRRHDIRNILIGVINLAIAGIGGYYLQKLLEYAGAKNFGLFNLFPGMALLKIVTGFILLDLFMYWWHRANHELKFLWRFHSFHHQDEKLNSTSAVRFHAVELMLSYVIKFSLFPLLGLGAATIVLYAMLLFPVIVFHHSNIRISVRTDTFLRHLFVTPHMHRIHHSKMVMETNSNYGSIFPYWDNLFRSYVSKPAKPVEFGID